MRLHGLLARDVATPQLALHLLGPPINPRHDNWVDPGVKLGAKTTVGAGCIIGPGTSIGDKGSVKRSVVGADCKIGSNAKVGDMQRSVSHCTRASTQQKCSCERLRLLAITQRAADANQLLEYVTSLLSSTA